MTQELVLSIGKADHFARIVSVKRLTWAALADLFKRDPAVSEDKASEGWFSAGEFRGAYRDSENLVRRYALTFDFDKITPADVAQIEATYRDYAYIIYTTASHTRDKPRLRMIFPLSRPATAEEFCAVTRKHGARFDLEKLARESDVPAQMMFLPTRKPDGIYRARVNEGRWIDVDAVLAEYADWRNREQWPRRLSGDSAHHGNAEGVKAPDEKLGIVGDFCRSFRITEAISRFDLPYAPGSGDRFTYTAGTRPDGLRLYDEDRKAHSEHDTDPAHGQTNAFDLVRLHKFGKLDSADDLAKPVTERPSYREMVKLAMEQPELRAQQVAQEFVDLGPLPDEQPTGAQSEGAERVDQKTPIVLARPLVDVLQVPTIPRWLLRDRLERGVIALMAGPRGSYKSFIATDWGMEIALAVGPVYTVSAEGADYDRRARAYLRSKAPDKDPKSVPMFVLERRIDLNVHENIELIRQDCVRLGIRPVMFVLDTFSKLSGGLDENSNTEVKAFIGRLDNGLKRAFDATVLLIAHTGHTDKGRARGASALEADTDAAYIVTRNDGLKNVSITRQRFKASPELDPLWLEPEVVDLDYSDHDGQKVTSLIMRYAAKPTNAPKVDGMTESQRAVMKTVVATLAGQPDGSMVVDQLIPLLVEATVKPVGRDTRAQTSRRTLQTLIDREYLFLKKNRVTLTRGEFVEEFN